MNNIPNPIIVDADVAADTLLVDADVAANALSVEAQTTAEMRPMPHITIGTVETLATGEDATATMTGTYVAPVLNLGLPRGEQGFKGFKGSVESKDSKANRAEMGLPDRTAIPPLQGSPRAALLPPSPSQTRKEQHQLPFLTDRTAEMAKTAHRAFRQPHL